MIDRTDRIGMDWYSVISYIYYILYIGCEMVEQENRLQLPQGLRLRVTHCF